MSTQVTHETQVQSNQTGCQTKEQSFKKLKSLAPCTLARPKWCLICRGRHTTSVRSRGTMQQVCNITLPPHMKQSTSTRSISFAFLSTISGTSNFLFKVLFTFPSWYLFAINFKPIFSFGWNLPPTLRSIFKEHDSCKHAVHSKPQGTNRTFTFNSASPQKLSLALLLALHLKYTIQTWRFDFQYELFLVHSPLLQESCSVCCPPLTYMLKFSRSACLTSCFQPVETQRAHHRSKDKDCTTFAISIQSASNPWEADSNDYCHPKSKANDMHLQHKAKTLKKACFQEESQSTWHIQQPIGSRNSASHND